MPTHIRQALARRLASGTLDALLTRVIGEYQEMPGLSLTMRQAQKLWHLDEPTCRRLLTTLVDQEFLTVTPRGVYVRCE